MATKFVITFICVLLLVEPATPSPLGVGICQAGCAGLVTTCFTVAGFTFGTVPGAVIAATPALAACNTAFGLCYKACFLVALAPV